MIEVPVSPAKPDTSQPDAWGQAALLLAESTLYILVEAGVLTRLQAMEAVRTAGAVKVEVADEAGESKQRMRQSLDLLLRIEHSMALMAEPVI